MAITRNPGAHFWTQVRVRRATTFTRYRCSYCGAMAERDLLGFLQPNPYKYGGCDMVPNYFRQSVPADAYSVALGGK